MSKRTLGILAGVVGSVVGTWWYARQRMASRAQQQLTPGREHGTVIYDNTPQATENPGVH